MRRYGPPRVLVFVFVFVFVLVLAALLAPVAVADEEGPPRPALPDAARTMEAIFGALEPVPVRILKMDVKKHSARLQVDAADAATFDAVRKALQSDAWLSDLARNPARLVEGGALRRAGGRTQGDLALRFRRDSGPPAPASTSGSIGAEAMLAAATEADFRMISATRERVTPNRAAGLRLITQTFEYEAATGKAVDLTLTKLRTLCRLIGESGTYRASEVTWSRAAPKDALPADCINKPRIEVAAWQPLAPPASTPRLDVGALAQAILRGPDSDLFGVAERLGDMDAKARLRLLLELREQVRIHAVLDHVRVEDLRLEEASLDDTLKRVLGPLGIPWQLSAKLRAELFDQLQLTLAVDSQTVGTVLALLTEPYEIRMLVRASGIHLVTAEEEEWALPDPQIALLTRLYTTKITLELDHVPFESVVETLRSMTELPLNVDPRIEGDVAKMPVAGIYAEDLPVKQVLDMLTDAAGDDIVWTVKGNVVLFTKRSLLKR